MVERALDKAVFPVHIRESGRIQSVGAHCHETEGIKK